MAYPRFLSLGFPLLMGLAPLSLSAQPALVFSWESSPPVVEGVSPGGSVAFLAVTRERRADHWRITVVRESATASADRVLVPWSREEVPPWSVWVAVEETTGVMTASSPTADFVPRPVVETLPGGTVTVAGRWVEILVVRPGGGRWGGRVTDGSAADRDGRVDDAVAFELAALESLAGEGSLSPAGRPGDRVVTIDLDTLAVTTSTVGGAP